VIVVDFPDPTNFAIGKLYTNSFYALLDQRLAASGYAVVQTTSPLVARQSFWTVVHHDRVGGPAHRAYHAHVPSFGEWGFVIASRRPWRLPDAAEGLRFLTAGTLPLLFDFPRDMARVPAEVNRLSNQVLVHTYEREWGKVHPNDARRAAATLAGRSAGPRRPAGPARGWLGYRRRLCGFSATSAATCCALHPGAGCAPGAAITRRVHTLIAGGGVAGLAAARALRQRGIDDFALLELEDRRRQQPGRPGGRHACPLGAHYLPVPGRRCARGAGPAGRTGPAPARGGPLAVRRAPPVPQPAGAAVFPRRSGRTACCRAGRGRGHAGAVPALCRGRATALRARPALPCRPLSRALVRLHARWTRMTLPLAGRRGPGRPAPALVPGLLLPRRLWRGLATVSAWAGCTTLPAATAFRAGRRRAERDAVLTWPEGNGWLTQRLAAPLGDGLHTGAGGAAHRRGRHGVDGWMPERPPRHT
jgi:hypothetical protein